MKKIIVLLLSILMVISICACGSDTTDTNADTNESTVSTQKEDDTKDNSSELKKYFDQEKYTSQKDEPFEFSDGSYYVNTKYTLKDEATLSLSPDISVGSTKITLNSSKVSELLDDGWKTNRSADYTVKTNSIVTDGNAISTDNRAITFHAFNHTESPIKFSDCTIEKIYLNYVSSTSKDADFSCEGDINKSSSPDDVINVFGNPTKITICENYDKDGNFKSSDITLNYTQSSEISIIFTFNSENENIRMTVAKFDF